MLDANIQLAAQHGWLIESHVANAEQPHTEFRHGLLTIIHNDQFRVVKRLPQETTDGLTCESGPIAGCQNARNPRLFRRREYCRRRARKRVLPFTCSFLLYPSLRL